MRRYASTRGLRLLLVLVALACLGMMTWILTSPARQATGPEPSPQVMPTASATGGEPSVTAMPAPTSPVASSTTSPPAMLVHPITPDSMSIPALRRKAKVVGLPSHNDAYGIPPNLTQVGWWNGYPEKGKLLPAPKPGGPVGNANIAVFIAHTALDDKSGVFAGLETLRKGDKITLGGVDEQGRCGTLVLEVTGQAPPAKKTDIYALNNAIDAAPADTRAAFITCSGPIDWNIGHHEFNTVVFAKVLSWTPCQGK